MKLNKLYIYYLIIISGAFIMTSIKNYIPNYPAPGDKNLIVKLSKLKEFSSLQLEANENVPNKRGIPLKHQELDARHMSIYTPYRSSLFYQKVGSGKTCAASLIVERFKRDFLFYGDYETKYTRKPALVFVRNSALKDAMRKEISNQCTKDVYLAKLNISELRKLSTTENIIEMSEEAKLRRINEAISKTYEIVKYGDLLDKKRKGGKGLPSDIIIRRDYSDRIIIVDEIQNIRLQPSNSSDKNATEKNNRYKNLHHFLHTVEGCMVILLTGTPIWDKAYDITGPFNLILPMDEQFPVLNNFTKEYFDENNVLKPEKAREYVNKIRGKVSFIRALTSTAKRYEVGVTEPWSKHIKIYPVGMEKFQADIVREAMNLMKTKKIKGEKKQGGAFYSDARDAANCIYPKVNSFGEIIGGVYGKKAFSELAVKEIVRKIEKTGKKTDTVYIKKYKLSESIAKFFGPVRDGQDEYANLRKFNPKLVAIIKMLRDPTRLQEKAFIYNDSVSGTGGIISNALILQLWGFVWLKDVSKARTADITTTRPGTFITVTSQKGTVNETAQIRKALEVYNADDNVYGSKIRIILGSEAISQGYTIKAVRQAHDIQGGWNEASADQTFGRTYRTGSHQQLKEEERFIYIYRYAAVELYQPGDDEKLKITLPKGVSEPSGGTFSSRETIDPYIYQLTDLKEFMSSQIYRLTKEASWNCPIAYNRNVLVTDVDGTRDCDYTTCNYKCDGYKSSDIDKVSGKPFTTKKQGKVWSYKVEEDEIDDSNYNLLYSKHMIDEYIENVIEIFHNYFELEYDMIVQFMNHDNPVQFILLRALSIIINERIPIRNRYGFYSYLNEVNNIYYLDTIIVEKSDYLNSVYTSRPMISETPTLEDIVEVIQLNDDQIHLCKFMKDPSEKLFSNFSYRTKIVLLEASFEIDISDTSDSKSKKVAKFIVDSMKTELFLMSDNNYVHNMYNSEYSGTSYNQSSKNLEKNGRLRVYDKTIRAWRYVYKQEEEGYISEIKKLSSKVVKSLASDITYPVYGAIDSKTQKFKIYDDREGKSRAGRVCLEGGVSIAYLYEVFHHLGNFPYKDETTPYENMSKVDLINSIKTKKTFASSPYSKIDLSKKSKNELVKLYTLFTMDKTQLCNSLERYLKENKMYITV